MARFYEGGRVCVLEGLTISGDFDGRERYHADSSLWKNRFTRLSNIFAHFNIVICIYLFLLHLSSFPPLPSFSHIFLVVAQFSRGVRIFELISSWREEEISKSNHKRGESMLEKWLIVFLIIIIIVIIISKRLDSSSKSAFIQKDERRG